MLASKVLWSFSRVYKLLSRLEGDENVLSLHDQSILRLQKVSHLTSDRYSFYDFYVWGSGKESKRYGFRDLRLDSWRYNMLETKHTGDVVTLSVKIIYSTHDNLKWSSPGSSKRHLLNLQWNQVKDLTF